MMRSLILTKYHANSLWNWRSVYLGRLIEPIAYIFFLAGGVSGLLSDEQRRQYLPSVFTGILCLLAFRSFTSAVGDVANDRKWGVFAIYRMHGGTAVGYAASIVMISVLVFVAQVVLAALAVIAVGVLSGISIASIPFLADSVGAVLIAVGWIGFGAATGAAVQNYSTRDLITTVTSLPVVLSAPLFYPADTAPGYIRAVSRINPLTYNVEWLRNDGVLAGFVWPAMWAVAGVAVAVVALERAEQVTRER